MNLPAAPFPKKAFIATLCVMVLVWLCVWDMRDDIRQLDTVTKGLKNYLVMPDFSKPVLKEIGWAFIETLEMAFLGTLLGAIIALPVSLLASDMGAGKQVAAVVRGILAFIRAVPLLFYGLVLVQWIGFGMVAGVVAMMIYTLGLLSKQFFDEIHSLDDTVAHALMSTGASRWQVLLFGHIPELLPNFLAFILLRFEINIREASILGVVGAGGFGILLKIYGTLPPYGKLWTLILCVFAVVVVIELICRLTMKWIKD